MLVAAATGEIFMQVSVEAKEGFERTMTVEVPAERVNEEIEKRLKKIARTAKLDGFRPGKAPISVIRRLYKGQVYDEVFREMLQTSYFEALSQEDLKPAGEPTITALEKKPEEGFGFTATFEVMPEVVLQDMDGITIKRPVAEVCEADIDAMLEKLRKQRIAWIEVPRAAKNNDQIAINFKGYIDGELFDGGSADDVPLILGSNNMIDGFEAGLVGAKAGETRTLELIFSEDYNSEKLAGKPAKFEVNITKVSESELPKVDEEFAKTFGVADGGVEGLRKDLQENLEREVAQRANASVKDQVMAALLETNAVDIPQILIAEEAGTLKKQAEAQLAAGAAARGESAELNQELFLDEAKRRVALGMIMSEVVKNNEMEIDAKRLRDKVNQIAANYDDPDEVVQWYYSNQEQLGQLENVVLEEQITDWVLEQVTVEEEKTTFAELTGGTA
ncbi:Cell division trigger factor [hydrothermal vent metagenome]|uniref:peptidylprolyl isomerase n=1 Tax=hydrothermal vent metagenome TaxID=652676 RepID=A0A3B1AMV1_9ZZZZ